MRFLAPFILLALASCGGEESAASPSLQQLLPDGRVEARRMQIRLPLPIAGIAFVMQQSLQQNKEWAMEYMEANDVPGPLPYHENFGVTEEEYDRYIASVEAGESALRDDAAASFEVTHFGEKSKLRTGESLATVDGLEFDWSADAVRTPWGDLIGSEPLEILGEKAALAPFSGRRWELVEGKIDDALGTEAGTAKLLRVYLGTRNEGQDTLLFFRAASVVQGVIYVNDEVILQWPQR